MLDRSPAPGNSALVLAQAMLVALATAAMLAPPAQGRIAILPWFPGDPGTTLRWSLAAGARPIEMGPYPGSFVVEGSSSALLRPALAHGAVLIAARFAACGQ